MSSRRSRSGGTLDRDHAQPEVEVLAERPLLDLLLEVLVGRGDDPDVDLDRARRAEPLDFAFLQHAQHLGLRLGAHVADFVEEDRAAVGLLELADLLLGGAGERPFLVPEELRFDQLLGNRRAVHLDEPLAAAQAVAMDRARDQLLAGAALALQQHGRVGRRRALDGIPDLAQRRSSRRPSGAALRRRAGAIRFSSDSRVRSRAFLIETSSFSLDGGFSMKSKAPALVASTAVLTVPCPEMMTTGRSSFAARSFCSTSRPSIPGILMSRKTRSGASRSASAMPSGPLEASMTS